MAGEPISFTGNPSLSSGRALRHSSGRARSRGAGQNAAQAPGLKWIGQPILAFEGEHRLAIYPSTLLRAGRFDLARGEGEAALGYK